jgi:hypothetical protein
MSTSEREASSMRIQVHGHSAGAARLAVTFGLLCALAPVSSARATRGLPGQIRSSLALGYMPQCSLCHEAGKTGNGTVFTPFALSARARGLTASGGGGSSGSHTSPVSIALTQMATDQVDSDGDGVTDVEELKAGTDPNVPGAVPMALADPTYGCSTAGGVALWPGLLALGAGALRTRRFRRRWSKPRDHYGAGNL